MKTVIATDAGARPVGPYSQAIRANGLILSAVKFHSTPKPLQLSMVVLASSADWDPSQQSNITDKLLPDIVNKSATAVTRRSLFKAWTCENCSASVERMNSAKSGIALSKRSRV
jgi:hypothetical protein